MIPNRLGRLEEMLNLESFRNSKTYQVQGISRNGWGLWIYSTSKKLRAIAHHLMLSRDKWCLCFLLGIVSPFVFFLFLPYSLRVGSSTSPRSPRFWIPKTTWMSQEVRINGDRISGL